MSKEVEYINALISAKFPKERSLSCAEVKTAGFLGIVGISEIKIIEITKEKFLKILNKEALQLLKKHDLAKESTNAITFGNRIFLFKSNDTRKTIAHELVHVYQYEKLGIEKFVNKYITDKQSLEVPAYNFGDAYKDKGYRTDRLIKKDFEIL